jgi:hypothetical protein
MAILKVAALPYKDHANVRVMKEFISFVKFNGYLRNKNVFPRIKAFIKENHLEELLLFVI